jgi:hypothetical protein
VPGQQNAEPGSKLELYRISFDRACLSEQLIKIGKSALRESNMRTYRNGDIVGAHGDRPDKINKAPSDRNPSILR